ncbi:MAG: hypothetical protein WCZ86_06100 [Desulfurivibrionaceae bacterium]
MPELLRDGWVKAKKEYRCQVTSQVIQVGESHRRQVCVYEGQCYNFRMSAAGSRLWNRYYSDLEEGDGVSGDAVREAAVEEFGSLEAALKVWGQSA